MPTDSKNTKDAIMPEGLEALRNEIKDALSNISKKLDLLLDPKTGVFSELRDINNKADKAHTRIDDLEKGIDRLKDRFYGDMQTEGFEDVSKENRKRIEALERHRDDAVSNFRKVFYGVLTAAIISVLGWLATNISWGG